MVANITFIIAYPPPNLTVCDFDTRLAELEDTLRDTARDLIMGENIIGLRKLDPTYQRNVLAATTSILSSN